MTVTKHSHCQKGPDSSDSDLRQCSDSARTVLRQCSDSPDSSDSTDSQGSEVLVQLGQVLVRSISTACIDTSWKRC